MLLNNTIVILLNGKLLSTVMNAHTIDHRLLAISNLEY